MVEPTHKHTHRHKVLMLLLLLPLLLLLLRKLLRLLGQVTVRQTVFWNKARFVEP
jgi:hypothetical protein